MRAVKMLLCGALVSAAFWSSAASASIFPNDAEGWHTWQVDEQTSTTQMCCFSWKRGEKQKNACHLDGRNMSFTDSGDCAATPGTIQVFVRLVNGVPKDVRVLSSNCAVTASTEIIDHGLVSTAENMDWFQSVIEDKSLDDDLREEALFGLVLSESDAAYDYLDRLLSAK